MVSGGLPRGSVVHGAWVADVILRTVLRQGIHKVLVALTVLVFAGIAFANPGNGVIDERRRLAGKFGSQQEVVVFPKTLGRIDVGLGRDVFAIVWTGVGGSRGNQRDRAECGDEADTRRSHQRVTFLQLSVVHLETIENDSQYWIIF